MALLRVENLWMQFGGLTANWGISFEISPGEMVGLIGPNGAGKSTLFNCIAGLYTPTRGRIYFADQEVTGRKPYEMARMGLARTFQVYVASGDLTVLENVMVGCFLKTRSRRLARQRADELLGYMRLSQLSGHYMANLPVAAQKRVVMATALATEPKLLLLDEVAAGLNPTETEEIIGLIQWVNKDMRISVILIEHVMEMVMNLSHRVLVLDSGTLIAEGEPGEVVRKPEVISAYLGDRYLKDHPEVDVKGESGV
jgi:branched-chain amino acid transport system ATP-binding protein